MEISVVVTVWNKFRYIRKTLDSVLNQKWSRFELIVVDDGSTDGSRELIVEEFSEKAKVVFTDNIGPGPARNTGAAHAYNQWLAFLDGDDLWTDDHLVELVRLHSLKPSAGLLVGGSRKLVHSQPIHLSSPARNYGPPAYTNYLLEAHRRPGLIHTSAVAINRQAFYSAGQFGDFRPGQDVDLWVRLTLKCETAFSPLVTSFHLLGTGGVMDSSDMHGLNAPPIRTGNYYDVSALLGRLNDYRFTIGAQVQRSHEIEYFINRKLLVLIKVSLYSGDVARAQNLSRFLFVKQFDELFLREVLLRCPALLLRFGLAAARRLNKIFH